MINILERCNTYYISSNIHVLDVLDEMEKINICVEYDEDKPVYKEFEGWLSSTEGVTEYKNLPKNAKKYIVLGTFPT